MANDFVLERVSYTDVGVDGRAIGTTTYYWSATVWKSPLTTQVGKVYVPTKKMNSPTDGVYACIYSNDSTTNTPLTLLGTSNTVDSTSLTTSLVNTWFTFSTPVNVVKDTLYWIVWKRTGSLDNTNYYRVGYSSSYNMFLTNESYYWGGSSWTSFGTNTKILCDIWGTSNQYAAMWDSDYGYTALLDWASTTTNFAIGHQFTTPAGENSYMIECVLFGWGGASPYGCSSGDCDIYCEIHENCDPSTDTLDFATNTTRNGGRSDGVNRCDSDAYTSSRTRYFRWENRDDRPLLLPNTTYWLVFRPVTVGDGNYLRIGRISGDPLGDGFDTWRIKSDGDFNFSTNGYILNNGYIITSEVIPVGGDVIIPWTIVEQDYWPIGNDFILLNHILAAHLDSDFVTRWGILLAEDTILKYGLISVPTQDFVLKWKVLNEAQWDTIFRWGIIVDNEYIFPWTLRHLRASDVVLPMPIVMATDVDLVWGINTRLYQDHIFRWFIESKIWRDIALRYHIKVETDHILLIPLLTPIEQDHVLSYHLTQPIGSDTTIRFKIRDFNQVDADNKLRWVLSGRPRIYKIKFE